MPHVGKYRVVATVINGKAKFAVKVENTILSTHNNLKDAIRRAFALKNAEKQGKRFVKASAKAGVFIGKRIFKFLTEEEKPKIKKRKRKTKRRK